MGASEIPKKNSGYFSQCEQELLFLPISICVHPQDFCGDCCPLQGNHLRWSKPLCKWLTVSLGRALSWAETWMVFLWWADAQLTFNAKFSLPLWLSNDSSLNSACILQTYTTIICPCVLSGCKNVSQTLWGALSKAISFKIKWGGKYRLNQFIICL